MRDEGVHRPMLLSKVPGKDPFQASFLASSSSLTYSNITPIFTWHPPMCMSVATSNFPLSMKTSVRIGHTQMISFYLIFACLQIRSHSGFLGVRTPIHLFSNPQHHVVTKPSFPTSRQQLVLLSYAASDISFFLSTSQRSQI